MGETEQLFLGHPRESDGYNYVIIFY